MTSRSFIVYNYKCGCGRQYVGKTTQVLSERIRQNVPRKPVGKTELQSDSAIAKRQRQNAATCIRDDDQTITKRFQVLTQARSRSHLDVPEAIYIRSIAPDLCQQKYEFTRTLKLVLHNTRKLQLTGLHLPTSVTCNIHLPRTEIIDKLLCENQSNYYSSDYCLYVTIHSVSALISPLFLSFNLCLPMYLLRRMG